MWGMILSPAVVVFIGLSLFGTILVFTSSGMLGMWVGLELGLFGFLPLLNGKGVSENEAAVKYFVVQAVGSGIMLVSFLLVSGNIDLMVWGRETVELTNLMMVIGFMVKLGVFPLHFWFPSVMGSASWFSCFWLSVVQKIGPFWGVSGLGLGFWVISFFSLSLVVTSLVGAVGGFGQVQFRPLLAYSSLGQTGWMGLMSLIRIELFILYMLIYSLILAGLLWVLFTVKSYSFSELSSFGGDGSLFFWIFSGGFFMSLSGLPPLAGSALKLMGVLTIVGKYPLLLGVLIGTSMLSLYYYLGVFINSVVCLGLEGYKGLFAGAKESLGVMIIGCVVVMNWVGGLPLFLVCGLTVL